ncbi:MAG: DUF448 domain-containing protein [Proteobacteria bacterium]|nr:DUF448 domain-containing protein [Pseudomonadota bacterium]MDA0845621.1 DUF448 domain-containing protein [Pseudomonadota bacterium]
MAERTCITTGQTLPPHRLIRFVAAPDGYAIADLAGKLPGRGAWVTASEDAIRKADKRGHFKRALGGGLLSDDQTIMMIAAQLRARVLSIAGLARRSGILLGGSGKLLAEGHCVGLLAADDASPRETEKLRSKLAVDWVARNFSATELGRIFGRDSIAFVGVRASTSPGADKLSDILHQEIIRLDGFYGAVGCNDLPDGCIT